MMVAGQSGHPLTQGQGRAEIHHRIKRAFMMVAGQSWHPLTQGQGRGLKRKQKSSKLSSPLFLLENVSCRVSLLANHLSPCHAAF